MPAPFFNVRNALVQAVSNDPIAAVDALGNIYAAMLANASNAVKQAAPVAMKMFAVEMGVIDANADLETAPVYQEAANELKDLLAEPFRDGSRLTAASQQAIFDAAKTAFQGAEFEAADNV